MDSQPSDDKKFDQSFLEGAHLDQASPVSSLGQGYTLIRRTNEPLTREFADKVLSLQQCPFDRGLNNSRVVELMRHMKQGTFLPEQVQIGICELDGKKFRINGQHVCWARTDLDQVDKDLDKRYSPIVSVLHYRASTEEDMRLLYANTDRQLPRSNSQVYVSYLFDCPEFRDAEGKPFPKTIINAIAFGVRGWLWGFATGESTQHKPDEVAYKLKTEYYETAMRVVNFLHAIGKQKIGISHLKRGSVYAAMFATFEKHNEMATDFWKAVADGANLQADDPRLKLRNNLNSYSINAGRGGSIFKAKTVDGEQMYRWCIAAWNAYRDGKELKVLRATEGEKRPQAK